MKKIILLLALPALLFVACNNDDDNNHEPIGLTGDWKLVKTLHGIIGGSTTFEPGAVTWTFSESNRKLIINNAEASAYSGPQSGTYSYNLNIGSEWCLNTITVSDPELGACFIPNADTLTVGSVSDGPVYKLVR